MATSITDVLGEDFLCREVFLRLPVKSIFTLRSVCKPWNAVVSSPSFVAQHLNWGLTAGTRQSFIHKHVGMFTIDAVQGVVCIASARLAILWNPFIHKHVLIPIKKEDGQPPIYPPVLGFGFCSSTNDFKLVFRIGLVANYKVFSVQDQSWRKVLVSDHLRMKISTCFTTSPSCFAHGNIHWLLGYKEHEHERGVLSYTLLVFDCEREEFSTMELPPDAFTYVTAGRVTVFRFAGKLSVLKFLCYGEGYSEAWVMGEYGVPSSWYKLDWLDDNDLDYTKSITARVFEESMFLADSKGPTFSSFKKLGLPHTPDHDWVTLEVGG